jgi:hypothetical protein
VIIILLIKGEIYLKRVIFSLIWVIFFEMILIFTAIVPEDKNLNNDEQAVSGFAQTDIPAYTTEGKLRIEPEKGGHIGMVVYEYDKGLFEKADTSGHAMSLVTPDEK